MNPELTALFARLRSERNVTMSEQDRSALIEMAYYKNHDNLATEIVLLDEEISGVIPPTAPIPELIEQLDYWLGLAAKRWKIQLGP